MLKHSDPFKKRASTHVKAVRGLKIHEKRGGHNKKKKEHFYT